MSETLAIGADLDVCPPCFTVGKLPAGSTSADFMRIVTEHKVANTPPCVGAVDIEEWEDMLCSNKWSDQETLLLLEGLEQYGESWGDVAEHIGTKSVEECIRRFICMPIEERFLDEMNSAANAMAGSGLHGVDAEVGKSETRSRYLGASRSSSRVESMGSNALSGGARDQVMLMPFIALGNPVIAQAAFLTAVVSPRVSAAAACAALETMAFEGYECLSADQEQISRVADAENACMELKQPSEFDKTCSFKSGTKEAKTRGITTAQSTRAAPSEICVQLAAATGLTAAALKAKLLAEREEHEVLRLVVTASEQQVRKMELKLRYFEDLEMALEQEREQVVRARQQIFADFSASQAVCLPHIAHQVMQPKASAPASNQHTAQTQPAAPIRSNPSMSSGISAATITAAANAVRTAGLGSAYLDVMSKNLSAVGAMPINTMASPLPVRVHPQQHSQLLAGPVLAAKLANPHTPTESMTDAAPQAVATAPQERSGAAVTENTASSV